MTAKIDFRKPMGAARYVRREKYAWPGGYALALVVDDGGLICADCVRKEFHNIADSFRHGTNSGWRPLALTYSAEWEEQETCSHCGRVIE